MYVINCFYKAKNPNLHMVSKMIWNIQNFNLYNKMKGQKTANGWIICPVVSIANLNLNLNEANAFLNVSASESPVFTNDCSAFLEY